MKCLVIGSVWPEPNSSAAGENMMALLRGAVARNWQITFACAAEPSVHAEDLSNLGIAQQQIALNHCSFDTFIISLCPDIVIFDRFMTEEQFGWRVSKHIAQAIRVLNTEDLHGLRKQTQLQLGADYDGSPHNDTMIREIASILRCDKTLIIAEQEISWLCDTVGLPQTLLQFFPLLLPQKQKRYEANSFEQRQHMSFIGNFKHAPNWHAVLYLHRNWPAIKKRLPEAQCHIYGAYPPKKATQLTNHKLGFYVKGWIDDANEAFNSYRVALAPLTFGAGIKGKLLRAISTHTPSVVSELAIQGICNAEQWPGTVSRNEKQFVDGVVELYLQEQVWLQAQHKARKLQTKLSNIGHIHANFFAECESLLNPSNLTTHRDAHILGKVVTHQTIRSHQYMAQWIEAKNLHKNV